MFVSNLSVSEFVLAEQEEAFPIRQVTGSSVYSLKYQWAGRRIGGGEIKELMRSLRDVHLCALYRMRAEARQVGAHAVIGVRLEQKRKYPHLWTPNNVIELKAIGTAVTLGGEDVPENPALSALSGQEFYALRRAGQTPVGLVFGQSVYYQLATSRAIFDAPPGVFALDWRRVNLNTERVDYTYAVAEARHLAMKRLETEADFLGAEGVVGVSVETRRALIGEDLIVEFVALGTAIVPHGPLRCAAGHSLSLAE